MTEYSFYRFLSYKYVNTDIIRLDYIINFKMTTTTVILNKFRFSH